MLAEACPRASVFFSIASLSSDLSTALRSPSADSALARSSPVTLSPRSFERLLDPMHHRIGAIAGLDQLAKLAILGRMRLGVLDHALDLVLVQAARGANHDALLL